MAIATTANYKTYAGISGTAQDGQLDVIIPAVQAQIERYCGRLFDQPSAPGTFTEYLDGQGSDVLMVGNPPITSITSIKLYRTPADAAPQTISSSLYTFNTDDSGIIRYQPAYFARFNPVSYLDTDGADFGTQPAWPRGFRNVQVVYVGAYTAATMPADVKLLLYQIVDSVLEQAGRDPTLNSEQLGSYQYYNGQISDVFLYFKSKLRPYRNRRMA